MLRLLTTISWRHVRRHRLRTLLTFLGMALGVAVIVAIALVNRSLTTSFQSTIEQIAGRAVLQVSNSESGFAEALFPIVRDTDGVADVAAAVDGFLPVSGVPSERLYVYGVDLLTDFVMRDHQFVGADFGFDGALDFIAQPDSIALTETFAHRYGLLLGSAITLNTSLGKQVYRVRALLKETGTAKVFGGNFALMDLPTAQRAFGKQGKLDIVDITVEAGASIESVQARLRQRLAGAVDVERPRKRGEQIESLLTSFRVGLFFVSLIALFVGFFLIYNTVAVSVVQRKREFGTLRCIGMRRGELLRLIVVEALLLAIVGAAIGCVIGWALAQAALLAVGETVRNLFSSIGLSGSSLTPRELGLALASAIGVALFAALHPALDAVSISPLENARQALWRPVFDGRKSWATRFGIISFAVALALIGAAPLISGAVRQFSFGVVGMLIFLLGLAFFAPLIIHHAVRGFWRSSLRFPGISWAESRLAADSLRRNPFRSAITVATLIISLAAIFTIAAFVNSVRGSLLAWVDQMVTADIIISSGARTAGPRNVSLHEEPTAGLRALPGVKVVDLYRLVRANYQGRPIVVESFSAVASASVRTLPMAEGNGARALREMAEGKGAIISESFQTRFKKNLGDDIEIVTPSGPATFKVLAVYIDYSSDIGSVLIDRALYKKYWRDELVDAFDLWLEPGADMPALIQRIKDDYGERYRLFISSHRELKDAVVRIMEQSFVVNYAVEIVAIVVAIFSVINTMLASVLDRGREIGVLRAIGATQVQVRRSIVMEAAAMGLIGGLLGLFAGSLMAYHHVVYNTKLLTGWTFQFYYPYGIAGLSVFAAIILCGLAGWGPAKQAASTPIVTAIGYE
ncbi:MAG: FtsX-like permease family protein [Deltaproteobacteria bacterium]|nr:FtsX-like permease family protein [Deltaproteobacteria bacterium]